MLRLRRRRRRAPFGCRRPIRFTSSYGVAHLTHCPAQTQLGHVDRAQLRHRQELREVAFTSPSGNNAGRPTDNGAATETFFHGLAGQRGDAAEEKS